ncbi:hypothetical protein [Streptomyces sp. NPDC001530]|uniref:hypothetical protein n=1 Tax=Streptomyces sp. NPDC001530 TaxID=3364582 RepID=UPI0036C24426
MAGDAVGVPRLTGERQLESRQVPHGTLPARPRTPHSALHVATPAVRHQETARTKGTAIGGVKVCDEDMLATVLRLRDNEHLSLREAASRLVIRTGKKRGRHPALATVMRMLREHDEAAALKLNP